MTLQYLILRPFWLNITSQQYQNKIDHLVTNKFFLYFIINRASFLDMIKKILYRPGLNPFKNQCEIA